MIMYELGQFTTLYVCIVLQYINIYTLLSDSCPPTHNNKLYIWRKEEQYEHIIADTLSFTGIIFHASRVISTPIYIHNNMISGTSYDKQQWESNGECQAHG